MRYEKHDPSQFTVPESDHNGRSVIVVQVPPLLKDDLIRWSLHHGVKELGAMESCTSVISVLRDTVMLAQMNMDLKRFEELFAKLTRSSSDYWLQITCRQGRASGHGDTRTHLSLPSSRDRSWALSRLRQRWGHLLISTAVRANNSSEDGGAQVHRRRLLHLVLGHRHVPQRRSAPRGRPRTAARSRADRDRHAVSRAGAVSRARQRA